MDASRIRRLTYGGLLTALIAALTAYVKITIPGAGGYYHPGDGAIALACVMLGPYAAIPAALGSALADALSGYMQYAPYTFVVKGLMGLIAGYGLARGNIGLRAVLSLIVASCALVGGYFAVDFMFGGVGYALAGIPWNALQAAIFIFSGIVFLVTGIVRLINKR
ncbi:MAG: ECF transporter S component [Christensenellales bacterium]